MVDAPAPTGSYTTVPVLSTKELLGYCASSPNSSGHSLISGAAPIAKVTFAEKFLTTPLVMWWTNGLTVRTWRINSLTVASGPVESDCQKMGVSFHRETSFRVAVAGSGEAMMHDTIATPSIASPGILACARTRCTFVSLIPPIKQVFNGLPESLMIWSSFCAPIGPIGNLAVTFVLKLILFQLLHNKPDVRVDLVRRGQLGLLGVLLGKDVSDSLQQSQVALHGRLRHHLDESVTQSSSKGSGLACVGRGLRVLAAREHDHICWRHFGSFDFLGAVARGCLDTLENTADRAEHHGWVSGQVTGDQVHGVTRALFPDIVLLDTSVLGSRSHHNVVHDVVDQRSRLLEVHRIDTIVKPIFFVSVLVLFLTTVSRVVEEQGVSRLSVFHQPLHGTDHVGLGWHLDQLSLVVCQHDNVLGLVSLGLGQIVVHVVRVVDTASQGVVGSNVIDTDQQSLLCTITRRVLKLLHRARSVHLLGLHAERGHWWFLGRCTSVLGLLLWLLLLLLAPVWRWRSRPRSDPVTNLMMLPCPAADPSTAIEASVSRVPSSSVTFLGTGLVSVTDGSRSPVSSGRSVAGFFESVGISSHCLGRPNLVKYDSVSDGNDPDEELEEELEDDGYCRMEGTVSTKWSSSKEKLFRKGLETNGICPQTHKFEFML
ncbi:hypothetical protein OGAPHI_004369 [Ogataea philodendri]|uniref:Uncharacterized protein n=1 Tax=Ogataea philodendri TaxID=1378263 RepID=A0A9P8P6K6_9ASCO|nr:uncharacterized protein OGAPHI_004369 [Ogataea philodendri]KAH3666180.1 hypothetical protein OGAPHI_004369 [Ogataea philodendri]